MTKEELFGKLKNDFRQMVADNGLDRDGIRIVTAALTPEEAIGITSRKDYPILNGKEIMLRADYKGSIGQAFTSSPAAYSGTLTEIIEADIENDDAALALFIASLNAVMKYLGRTEKTIHCRNDGPELCAKQYVPYIREHYGSPRIAQIGYQPALIGQLSREFELRVLDLNPDNVGTVKDGVTIEHGVRDYEEVVLRWADLVLCTGSTLANGSIVNYLDIGKDVIFFGTTLAGAAELLGLRRVCFESE